MMKLKPLIFCLLLVLSSCTKDKGRPSTDKDVPALKENRIVVQISGINEKPWNSNTSFDLQIHFNQLVFSQLLEIGERLEISPGIVKSWNWEAQSSQYILKIAEGVKYHDGSNLQIQDVEYALLRRYLRPFQDGDHMHDQSIVGVEKIKKGVAFRSGMCEGLKIIDPTTIAVKLRANNPLFLYSLTESAIVVAPRRQFNKRHEFKTKVLPTGTGPFRVTWSDPKSSRVRLERVETPKGKGLVTTIDLHSEGVEPPFDGDILIGAPTKYADSGVYQRVQSSFPISMLMMDFNYSSPEGRNIDFRTAVSYALDRNLLSKEISNSKPLHELIPEGFFGRNSSQLPFDAVVGQKIVQKRLKDLQNKKLYGAYHGLAGAEKPDFILAIERQLKQIGLSVVMEPKKNTDFVNLDKKYVLSVYGFATSFVDPLSAFKQYVQGGPSMKFNTDTKDKVAKDLFTSAEQTDDKIRKSDILQKLSQHFQKQKTTLPLLSIPLILAFKKNHLEPIPPSKSFIFDLKNVRTRQ